MPPPIEPGKRAAILVDIEAGDQSCRAIAEKHGVGASTVSRIARDEGLEGAFARAKTKDAIEARRVDMAKERAEVSALFLRRAREALEQFDKPHLVFNIGGKDNVYTEHLLDRPPTSDMRNLATVAGITVQRHLEIERSDSTDTDEGVSMLGRLAEGLSAAYEKLTGGGGNESSTPTADAD